MVLYFRDLRNSFITSITGFPLDSLSVLDLEWKLRKQVKGTHPPSSSECLILLSLCPWEKNATFNFFLLQIAYLKLKPSPKYCGVFAIRQIHVIFGTNCYCCVTTLGSQPVFVGDHRSSLLGTLDAYLMFSWIAVGLIWVPLQLIAEDLSWFLNVNPYLPTSLWT